MNGGAHGGVYGDARRGAYGDVHGDAQHDAQRDAHGGVYGDAQRDTHGDACDEARRDAHGGAYGGAQRDAHGDARGRRQELLAERFESHRGHLRGVAHRMLGSLGDADDVVQEAWLRLSRADADAIGNLAGWLRTVVSRLCLDLLRSAALRHEEPAGERLPEPVGTSGAFGEGAGPEEEVLLADSVGRALLVVLDTLGPAERVAFVLHDLFAVPFVDIAPVVERTPVATKKLASRARQKVRGTPRATAPRLVGDRRVVETFLAAARSGDLEALLAVLAPDVVRRADPAALPAGRSVELRGARAVAEESVLLRRNARCAEAALIDGSVGLVVAPRGRLLLALLISVEAERVAAYEVIADRKRLRELRVTLLPEA
ncbi:sigma-70 family RNA polymerase sigma factor [Streptomyces sp. DSM 118878]